MYIILFTVYCNNFVIKINKMTKGMIFKKTISIGAAMGLCLFVMTGTAAAQGKWVAPASEKSVKNPIAGDANATKEGKKLYITNCAPCHGDKGKGDGPASATLNPRPANHSSEAVQSQTDGEIFYKLSTGRGAMAAYKAQFNDKQRWSLVNYIRTLKK
jgi:mono/diheme cytochrome c family protein